MGSSAALPGVIRICVIAIIHYSFVDILGTFQQLSERCVGGVLLVDLSLDWLQLSAYFFVSERSSVSQGGGIGLVGFLDLCSLSCELALLFLDPSL